jgi:chromosome partitioning protein
MSVPVIAFFNNKGGVGKTSLVYHLAWMYADLGTPVVAVDLDPQANLSTMLVDEDRLEEVWSGDHRNTVFGCIRPLRKGIGDIADPNLETVDDNLALLIGDLALSEFEDILSQTWPKCLDREEAAFRAQTAFWRIAQRAAHTCGAQVILMDLGPNLGSINRSALISSDYVVIPLSPDLFSLQGLRNLGPTFVRWRAGWSERREKIPTDADLDLPSGAMMPAGYVVMQHSLRLDRPAVYYNKWIERIPDEYREYVLQEPRKFREREDRHRLALLKHYRSLMPMAQEARKPIFHLKAADGAIGAHSTAAREAGEDFRQLAQAIAKRCGITLKHPPSTR